MVIQISVTCSAIFLEHKLLLLVFLNSASFYCRCSLKVKVSTAGVP